MSKLLVIPILLIALLASSCQVITGTGPEVSTTPAATGLPVTQIATSPPARGPVQPTVRVALLAEENITYGPGSIYQGLMAALETEGGSWPPRQYLCTFDLATLEKTRVLELPDKRLAEPPAMYGRYLVWASVDAEEYMRRMASSHFPTPAPNYDIFLLDMKTGKVEQLTTEEHAQEHPVIYGDTVAWMDARNEEPDIYPPSFDIYAMDLATRQERRVTENPTAEGYDRLAISKSVIVWTDNRHADHGIQSHPSNSDNYNNEIYAYDLDTGKETRITDSPANDHGAAIDRDTIVWLRQGTLMGGDIFAYDLNTGQETRVSASGYAEFEPSVSGGYVVWSDARVSRGNTSNDVIMNGVQGQADVYLFDLTNGREELLTPTEPGQVATGAIVSNGYVVYAVGGATTSIYVVNLDAPATETAGVYASGTFRSDEYYLTVKAPVGWGVTQGPELIPLHLEVEVAFNSWGEDGFWATDVVSGRSSRYGPQEILSQVPPGGAYIVLIAIKMPPTSEEPAEYLPNDFGDLLKPQDWRQDDGFHYFEFYKWGTGLNLQVACSPDASDQTVADVNSLLQSWRFDATPAGNIDWAITPARQLLPDAVRPFPYHTGVEGAGIPGIYRSVKAIVDADKTVHFRFTYYWDAAGIGSISDNLAVAPQHWWDIDVLADGKAVLVGEGGDTLPF